MSLLPILQARVAERACDIAASTSDWPCHAGCDACCRSLADVPRMSRHEWEDLCRKLRELPGEVLANVLERSLALRGVVRPIQCPMLDTKAGLCLVYDARPIACRTYGFYRERDKGLYCSIIEERANRGEFDHVVWGNAESLSGLGEEQGLLDWLHDSDLGIVP